ncbi:hypothetical protein VTO42DRAFT_3825 [Malbranchea cinnamomea]
MNLVKVHYASQNISKRHSMITSTKPLAGRSTTPGMLEVVREALRVFELVQDLPNIVQVAGIVASTNPYATVQWSDWSLVITGTLLELYSSGPLQEILFKHCLDGFNSPQSAVQIGAALS